MTSPYLKSPPDIAQLVEHLTVDIRSDQMVPGSIPGVRICPPTLPKCRHPNPATVAMRKGKCRDPGSSRGPSDLQSDALPAELSRLGEMGHSPGSTRRETPASSPREEFCLAVCYDAARPPQYASAGNRARVTSMATMYSTTRPLMPCSPSRSTFSHPRKLSRNKTAIGPPSQETLWPSG